VRIVYVGHATVLIELDGVVLLTDPLLRKRVAHLVRMYPVSPPAAIDGILLSHLHADHLDFRSLAMLPPNAPIVLPARSGALVRRRTRRKVVELAVGDETHVGDVVVRAVRAVHADRRHPLSRRVMPLGFVVTGSHTVYFAGDTDLFPEMEALAPVDVALVPIWGWGPTLPPGHLDPRRAAEAVRLLRPRIAIPIHWGTYRVIGSSGSGSEPAELFRDEVARVAPDVEVRVLQPGEATAI
jgi:L-ascorbate metabolism protein UlaG (beta-lactamase superfamily)